MPQQKLVHGQRCDESECSLSWRHRFCCNLGSEQTTCALCTAHTISLQNANKHCLTYLGMGSKLSLVRITISQTKRDHEGKQFKNPWSRRVVGIGEQGKQ